MNQKQYEETGAGVSQGAKIARALRIVMPNWVEMPDLWRVSGAMAVHSRIADLRKAGMNIENKREVRGRIVHSFYRLVEDAPTFNCEAAN